MSNDYEPEFLAEAQIALSEALAKLQEMLTQAVADESERKRVSEDRERLEEELKLVREKVNQSDGTAGSTFKQTGTGDRMAKGIVETAYHALVDNEFRDPEKYIKVKELQDGWAILFGGDTSDTELVTETEQDADITEEFCRNVVKELFTEEEPLVKGMASSLERMREACDELTDKLDELRLTPVILQTKCDICPA